MFLAARRGVRKRCNAWAFPNRNSESVSRTTVRFLLVIPAATSASRYVLKVAPSDCVALNDSCSRKNWGRYPKVFKPISSPRQDAWDLPRRVPNRLLVGLEVGLPFLLGGQLPAE